MIGFVKKYFLSTLFNVGIMAATLSTGYWILQSWTLPLYTLFVFWVTRFSVTAFLKGENMHYKKWQLCFIWSYAVFVSLFAVLKVDLALSILAAAFAALLLSSKCNITDMRQWATKQDRRGRPSKHQHIYDFIRMYANRDDVMDFFRSLKYYGDHTQDVYTLIFVEGKTWSAAAKELGIDEKAIGIEVDKISMAASLVFKVNLH